MLTDSTSVDHQRGRRAEVPREIPPAGWKDIALRVKAQVDEDHIVLTAAGVAFWGFLALIPALAAFSSILGLLTSPSEVASRAQDLFGGLPAEAEELLTAQLETVASRTTSSLTIGLIASIALSLWSASGGMGHLIEGINIAYDEHDDRNFFAKKGLSLALTLGTIAFLVVASAGLVALPSILDAIGLPSGLQTVIQFAFWPVIAAGFAAGLAILYRYGPDRAEPEWRWVSWGSVIAVIVWIAASIAFRIYNANFGSYDESYGSLAAVVILMLWLFITALAVLLGAQINSEMEHQTSVDTTVGPDRPIGDRDAVVADSVGEAATR